MSDERITMDDVRAIRRCADQLKHLSAKQYDPPETSKPMGLESDRTIAFHAVTTADRIERRLSL